MVRPPISSSRSQTCVENPHGRDYDLLLASGEQVAVATLALVRCRIKGCRPSRSPAHSATQTDGSSTARRIQSIDTARIVEELEKGKVVIAPAFSA